MAHNNTLGPKINATEPPNAFRRPREVGRAPTDVRKDFGLILMVKCALGHRRSLHSTQMEQLSMEDSSNMSSRDSCKECQPLDQQKEIP